MDRSDVLFFCRLVYISLFLVAVLLGVVSSLATGWEEQWLKFWAIMALVVAMPSALVVELSLRR